ncbi:MAG: hypothetical protein AAGF28_03415 [Pseudomonadota bacterium]
MKTKHLITATCGLMACAFVAAAPANAKKLSSSEIRSTISDKRVMLATRWGGFPLVYDSSKRVTGDGTGLGLARFFAPKETGNWWVKSGQLCQKFPTWYRGRTFCFTLTKTGPKELKWVREDGYSGTATITN